MNFMLSKFRWMAAVMLVLTGVLLMVQPSGKAEAAAHELNSLNYETYDEDGRSWLRLELGVTGGEVAYTTEVSDLLPKKLHVFFSDTERRGVKSDSSLDGNIAKYLHLRQTSDGVEAIINFSGPVADQAYRIYFAEADRSAKKPDRMVIEIAADKLQSEYEAENRSADTFRGLEGRKIVLDPGHGGSDTGAHGPSGLLEKDATLAISLNVADILRSSGAIVTMTRDTDRDVYGVMASDTNELQARVDVGNRDPQNEIFVSIHCDAFTSPSAHGTGTFYYAGSVRGKLLADSIHESIVEETGLTDRGIRTARFYVIRNSNMPAVLVETAFISNPQEEALLGDADFQYKIAVAICRGIEQYFRMR